MVYAIDLQDNKINWLPRAANSVDVCQSVLAQWPKNSSTDRAANLAVGSPGRRVDDLFHVRFELEGPDVGGGPVIWPDERFDEPVACPREIDQCVLPSLVQGVSA